MRCTSRLTLASLAVAAALPVAAQSSATGSNVTISGYLDAGVFRDFDKTSKLGTIQRSNLAIAGFEDLGGGLKATFRLSTRFDLDTGLTEDYPKKPFWHDESTVGLQGSWGHLRLGRALSAMWSQEWQFDPWGNFNRIASPAWYQWHALTPSDPFGNNGTAEYGRINNGIFYDSPQIAGFTLRLSASPERQTALGATGRPYSVVVEYDRQAVAAMAALERNSLGDKNAFLAGKYRFGSAAVMLAHDFSRNAANVSESRATTLGGTYQMGATTLKAGFGHQRLNQDTNRFVSVGADYALSKRTTLYASLGNKRDAQVASRTAFGVGMSHAF